MIKIILAVLIVAGLAFYLKLPILPQKTQIKTVDQQFIASPSADTKTWKTYNSFDDGYLKNLKLNFSLNYPENWLVTLNNPNDSSFVPYVVFSQFRLSSVSARSS